MVTFPGFVDCIYLNAPDELHLDNGLGDVVTIKNKKYVTVFHFGPPLSCLWTSAPLNFALYTFYDTYRSCSWSDTVLWNPHLQMEACYKDFVCVENAQVL